MAMSPRLRRTGRQSPRSDTMPSGSTTRAAIATRTSTIAPGLQPVSSSPLANTPDRLKAAAETPANTSPVVRRRVGRARTTPVPLASGVPVSGVTMPMGPDARVHGVTCQHGFYS